MSAASSGVTSGGVTSAVTAGGGGTSSGCFALSASTHHKRLEPPDASMRSEQSSGEHHPPLRVDDAASPREETGGPQRDSGVRQVLVVTGTGTGVGKTVVTAAIAALAVAAGRRVAVLKPVQTGVEPGERGDLDYLTRLVGNGVTLRELARYPDPLAPATAARRAGSRRSMQPARPAHGHRCTAAGGAARARGDPHSSRVPRTGSAWSRHRTRRSVGWAAWVDNGRPSWDRHGLFVTAVVGQVENPPLYQHQRRYACLPRSLSCGTQGPRKLVADLSDRHTMAE